MTRAKFEQNMPKMLKHFVSVQIPHSLFTYIMNFWKLNKSTIKLYLLDSNPPLPFSESPASKC